MIAALFVAKGGCYAEAWVPYADSDRYPDVPRLSPKEAKATPLEFRDALLSMARSAEVAA